MPVTKTRRSKPSPKTGWDAVRAKRNKFTAADWAHALRDAGDYSQYDFSLGDNPAVSFIDGLQHTGDYAGKAFELELWQEAFLRLVFDEDGLPRYRWVFLGLPRKNGKTELVGAIVCYLLFGTGIRSQNIYSGSGDAEQAALIHKAASEMIGQNEALAERCHVYKGNFKRIVLESLNSEYKALSSEAYSKFGLRPSVNLFDEVHVFPNRDLHAALETAYGATKRPCTIYISTAGWDQTSLCYELWKRARAAMADPKSDPRFLGVLYEFRDGDDWQDEAVWHRINPGLGKFRSLQNLREEMDNASKFPAHENECRQFYLNQWTEQAERWISVDAWKTCGGWFDPAELIGQQCYAGYDHGVTGDMACYFMVFPMPDGKFRVIGHGWAPKDGRWRSELRNEERYLQWERDGYLTLTEGVNPPHRAIDGKRIRTDIIRWHQKYPVYSLFADQAYATDLLIDLYNEEMMNVKGIAQGPVSLNEACVKLEELVVAGDIEHGDNPILNWAIANASLKRGTTGLVHPDKSSKTERIDALSALINALAAYKADPEQRGPSVYDHPNQLML